MWAPCRVLPLGLKIPHAVPGALGPLKARGEKGRLEAPSSANRYRRSSTNEYTKLCFWQQPTEKGESTSCPEEGPQLLPSPHLHHQTTPGGQSCHRAHVWHSPREPGLVTQQPLQPRTGWGAAGLRRSLITKMGWASAGRGAPEGSWRRWERRY